jgi:hypothetical protein
MGFSQADLLGFSIGSFVAPQIALVRPGVFFTRSEAVPAARSGHPHGRLGRVATLAQVLPARRTPG